MFTVPFGMLQLMKTSSLHCSRKVGNTLDIFAVNVKKDGVIAYAQFLFETEA